MTEQTGEMTPGLAMSQDFSVVQGLLPAGWQAQARALGALRRTRGFKDAGALLQVMFIHLLEGCGLRETAVRASLAGIAQVSDVAILNRLRGCGAWFEWMSRAMVEQLAQGRCAQLESAQAGSAQDAGVLAGRRVRVVDGSIVREPGPTGAQWRLNYSIELPSLHCDEVRISTTKEGETLRRFNFEPGDIVLADRGYAQGAGLQYAVAAGADVLVRCNLVTLALLGRSAPGAKTETDVLAPAALASLNILACLRGLSVGQAGDWPVSVRVTKGTKKQPPELVHGRLCAIKKSAVAALKARERVRREASRCQSHLRAETLEAADYVFVFTTLGQQVSAQQVLDLYRTRWQIEVTFKRLKSLTGLGHLKKHDERSAKAWLQGKLLASVLLDALITLAERVSPWGYAFTHSQAQPLPVA
jgi:hypothetical protein